MPMSFVGTAARWRWRIPSCVRCDSCEDFHSAEILRFPRRKEATFSSSACLNNSVLKDVPVVLPFLMSRVRSKTKWDWWSPRYIEGKSS